MERDRPDRTLLIFAVFSIIAVIALVVTTTRVTNINVQIAPDGDVAKANPGAKKFDHLELFNFLPKEVTKVKIELLDADGGLFGLPPVEVNSLGKGESTRWVYGFEIANPDDKYVAMARCTLTVLTNGQQVEHKCTIAVRPSRTLRSATFRIGQRFPEASDPANEKFYLAGEGLTEDMYDERKSWVLGHTDYILPSTD